MAGSDGSLMSVSNTTFTLSQPGPNTARQEAPHPHEAIVDLTGQYILVPDLGADLVRVFGYDNYALTLTEYASLKATPGSGPRHAVFYNSTESTTEGIYLFVVAELANTITSYAVTYSADGKGLSFTKVYTTNTFGGKTIPAGAAAAEIEISVSHPMTLTFHTLTHIETA